MLVTPVMVWLVGMLVAADAPKDDAKKELQALQGEWRVARFEYDGNAAPEDLRKQVRAVIKDDTFVYKPGLVIRDGKDFSIAEKPAPEARFKLAPAKNLRKSLSSSKASKT